MAPVVGHTILHGSPEAFHIWARHFFAGRRALTPADFTPVPYFLDCHASELEIKSRPLASYTAAVESGSHKGKPPRFLVKDKYSHDLAKAYDDLGKADQCLNQDERKFLASTSELYKNKEFEYFSPRPALEGYKNFPDLETLDAITTKLVGAQEE